ncbi:hypothetical protein KIN20_017396 [Parelaphostrongylus tenuis]|uniref:Uncharacterized protein n=1 Tax=Parelaphostrongylus tenuis TaxID=148309 RepID=A0AAD5QRF5_PARTN|nr:hypothetical protein KIN20_017396 [Parelaphostrongylus tenuis]
MLRKLNKAAKSWGTLEQDEDTAHKKAIVRRSKSNWVFSRSRRPSHMVTSSSVGWSRERLYSSFAVDVGGLIYLTTGYLLLPRSLFWCYLGFADRVAVPTAPFLDLIMICVAGCRL